MKFVIIGGGIIGLAVANRLLETRKDIDVTVLEKEPNVGAHQTGHNSGVLHAGLYYAPGSLKAKLCVEGLQRMIQFCQENGIRYEQCGKVVVATEESELPRLHNLYERGLQNGLKNIKKISKEELKEREPHAHCLQAVYVPQSGIADYGGVCQALVKKIQFQGGTVLLGTTVTDIQSIEKEWHITTSQDVIKANYIINCAGLHSDRILRISGEKPQVKIIPFRGEYYELKAESQHLVKHLIYPVPDPAFPFLGVHFTRMVKGGVECGPNAILATKREGYTKTDFSPKDFAEVMMYPGFWRFASKHWPIGVQEVLRSFSKSRFCKSLQRLVPELKMSDLVPGGSGVRAQAMDSAGGLIQDFSIVKAQGALHVLNTPSPAATASLAIADEIVKRL